MPRILVVEDEKNLRLLYKHDLEQDGHTVVTAGTAVEGIKALDDARFDLVILDIRMPGMDGLEAMGRVLEKYPKIPVILNSAYSSYKDNFMSWAADAYIIKSADTTELRTKVRDLLEARAADPSAES